MKYLLDTNVCIGYLNGTSPRIVQQLERLAPNQVFLSSIVKVELLYGALRSKRTEAVLARLREFFAPFPCLPLDDAGAEVAARIRATLADRGTPIGPNDLLIAATALANGLTLVSHNVREFERVEGLELEDWEA